VFSGKR
jgi:hypothetical protein